MCRPCFPPTSSKRNESEIGLARQFITLALLESGTTIAIEFGLHCNLTSVRILHLLMFVLSGRSMKMDGAKVRMLYRML